MKETTAEFDKDGMYVTFNRNGKEVAKKVYSGIKIRQDNTNDLV